MFGNAKLIVFVAFAQFAFGNALTGYRMVGEPIQIDNGFRVNLTLVPGESSWEGESQFLTLDAFFESNYRLRVKISNGDPNRFEVPIKIQSPSGGNNFPLYEIRFENEPMFSFKVVRRATSAIIFDSSVSDDFIFANQYVTLSWKVPSENVYGIGENEQYSFRHDFSQNLTWALWSKDHPPWVTTNLYGVHPYYTVLENDGNAHSVVIVNSNAQEFTMSSGPKIKYVTIGGLLDMYFFLGPTPENTVGQYSEAIGRPPIPSYWSLGFHLGRHGYDSIENMKATMRRNEEAGIPQDVQYSDIDGMYKNLDFTYSPETFPGLPDYIREFKRERGLHYVTILDPCISTGEDPEEYRPYKLGNEMGVWITDRNGKPVRGKVWPEDPCYFPDFSRNSTRQWWKTLILEFRDLLEYDGLWIDMNEPATFTDGDLFDGCEVNNLNYPPYVPHIKDGNLTAGTICMDLIQDAGIHYDVHSMYGWFEAEITQEAVREGTGKRSFVLSRNTFIGSGKWTAHWLGDNWSSWNNLHFSIIGILQFNHFGIPFNGPEICGFLGDSNAAMCQRWMQLGAFYPYCRNNNVAGTIPQDPAVWGPEVAKSSREVLMVRYTLLPYLYTLFYNSYVRGGTVMRALWHEFPLDSRTWGLDRQFMWGKGLLISPVLDEGSTQVEAYFPAARFYDYFSGQEESTRGGTITIPTPVDKINVHVRGGVIIPTQEPALNTILSRQNPYGLIVALDEDGKAEGELFNDEGIDTVEKGEYFLVEFSVQDSKLTSNIIKNGYREMENRTLSTLRLLGAIGDIREVKVNGEQASFEKLQSGEVVVKEINLKLTSTFSIEWS